MKEDSIFFKEWLATNRTTNQLPISAVCNSHCIFCSNHLNPFHIKKNIFRDIEDIKLQLSLMSPQSTEPIRMSDSLPGRISEGEAFLHPEFFKILELVRRRFLSNILCFTTNGSMLDEPFLKDLSRFRPISITVSMHSTQPDLWARIFRKSQRAARQAIRSLELIKKYHFDLIGTIVPVPKICGWDDIELTYEYFVSHGAKSMILYWPGYTVRTPSETVKELEYPLEEFLDFADRMRTKHKIPFQAFPDMKTSLDLPIKRIVANTLRGNLKNKGGPYRRVLWLTSEAAYSRLSSIIDENAPSFPNLHSIVLVKNLTYGGNIICAGLLMVNDFIIAGKQAIERWPDTELILVPGISFDTLLRDLQRTPAYRISDELNKSVWIVSEIGTFNSLLSRGFVVGSSSLDKRLVETMRLFNLAWQDEAHLEKSLDLIDTFDGAKPRFLNRGKKRRSVSTLSIPRASDRGAEWVDSYPIKTNEGYLSRESYRDMLLREKQRLPDDCKPLMQRFEVLDGSQALCMEKWPTKDVSITFNKWTFLIKRGSQWKIEYVTYGKEDDPCLWE